MKKNSFEIQNLIEEQGGAEARDRYIQSQKEYQLFSTTIGCWHLASTTTWCQGSCSTKQIIRSFTASSFLLSSVFLEFFKTGLSFSNLGKQFVVFFNVEAFLASCFVH